MDKQLICAFCEGPAEGNHSIHRDGFGIGPEVPLCDGCGSEPFPAGTLWWGPPMTTLHLPTGPRTIPDLAPAFAAPHELVEIRRVTRPGLPMFFSVPPVRFQMEYRTRGGNASMVGRLQPVSTFTGRVIAEVDGRWVLGEVRR